VTNVPFTSDDKLSDAAAPRRRLLLRVTLWTAASVALAVVFLGYQQVDLAIAWITAKLC